MQELFFVNNKTLEVVNNACKSMVLPVWSVKSDWSVKPYGIDPFNKSNIYSFPLLTTYSTFEILLKTYSFNDFNSGKLYILDLLKGSIIKVF